MQLSISIVSRKNTVHLPCAHGCLFWPRLGLGLDGDHRRLLDMTVPMEPDPDPSRPRRSCGPIGDDLKQHGLLVGGAMDRRRAQDTYIVGFTQEAHQVVNDEWISFTLYNRCDE
jgi:hypothetical protein